MENIIKNSKGATMNTLKVINKPKKNTDIKVRKGTKVYLSISTGKENKEFLIREDL